MCGCDENDTHHHITRRGCDIHDTHHHITRRGCDEHDTHHHITRRVMNMIPITTLWNVIKLSLVHVH